MRNVKELQKMFTLNEHSVKAFFSSGTLGAHMWPKVFLSYMRHDIPGTSLSCDERPVQLLITDQYCFPMVGKRSLSKGRNVKSLT